MRNCEIKRNSLRCDCWLLHHRWAKLSAITYIIAWIETWLFLRITILLYQMWPDFITILNKHLQVTLVDQNLGFLYSFLLKSKNHSCMMQISCARILHMRLSPLLARFRSYTSICSICCLLMLWISRNLLSSVIWLICLRSLLSPYKTNRVTIVTKCRLSRLWTCWSDCADTIFIQVNFLKRCVWKQILYKLSSRCLNLRFIDKLDLFTSCLNNLALGKWILVICTTNRVYKGIANICSSLHLWFTTDDKLTGRLVQRRS